VATFEKTPDRQQHGLVVDWLKGQQLWGSEQRHLEALRSFFIDFNGTDTRLRSALDAPTELTHQLHRLKGASANLALVRIARACSEIEREVAASNLQEVPAMLDQLAGELITAREALSQRGEKPVVVDAPVAAIDSARLLAVLHTLDDALAHGELAEGPLAALGEMLPSTLLEPLGQAINSFDFDAARQLVSALQIRFQTLEHSQ
jgi:HPt (histidine-containing phosphotransfer) domain-containing protein